MKKFKKLIPALCMLLVSAVLLGSSTYAWFSMNTKVSATGMTLQAEVRSNLYIVNESDSQWKTDDSTFASIATDAKSGKLVPVSSITGENDSFYFTDPDNVNAQGSAKETVYEAVGDNFSALIGKYGTGVVGYVDYHFILKAENTQKEEQYINLTKCNLTYDGEKDTTTAFRVAVLAGSLATATVDGAKTNATSLTKVTILTEKNATIAHFDENKAVKDPSNRDTVTYNSQTSIEEVAAQTTEYKEVVIRVWIEGEDKTCAISKFAELSQGTWSLEVEFELQAKNLKDAGLNGFTKYRSAKKALNGVETYLLYDGSKVFKKSDLTEITLTDTNVLTTEEATAIKTAFGIA